jgi:hypothetical protein
MEAPMRTVGFDRFCPACGHKNTAGVSACRICGTAFDVAVAEPNTTRQVDDPGGASEFNEQFIGGLSLPESGIAFYVAGVSTPIAVLTEPSFIIGRGVPETAVGGLVDLSAHDGFAMGVSRQHALVRAEPKGYSVVDLESRNGTWLNDQRLVPNRAYPLPSHAQLRLAMMRLFVVYRSP